MIQKTAIVGMGALGLLFGNEIAEHLGRDAVSYILDEDRYESYQNRAFTINGAAKSFRFEKSSLAEPADLVLVAVKYNSLSSALETMERCVDEHTIIISVMNGIDSESIIAERFGKERVLCCVAQGMDAVKLQDDLTYTKPGELRLGVFEPYQEPLLEEVKAYFDRAGVPYTIDADILHRLWGKFMLNVGVNQACMVYETNYRGVLRPGEANSTMLAAMREVMQLANLEGIALSEDDLESYIKLIGTLSPEGIPSMRQDGISKRPSEVEMFAGTVLRMAKKHGLPTPANAFLYQKVKEMEDTYHA